MSVVVVTITPTDRIASFAPWDEIVDGLGVERRHLGEGGPHDRRGEVVGAALHQ